MSTIENYYNFISDLDRLIKNEGKATVSLPFGFIRCDAFAEYENKGALILRFSCNIVAILDIDYLKSNYGYFAV